MASKQGSTDNVSVAVRVRPLNNRELDHQAENAWLMEDKTITQQNAKGRPIGTRYTFDHLFGPGSNTRALYDDVAAGIIGSTMEGFNGTIFAYGQTSSGKTHTMEGDKKNPGIIPLAVRDVFNYIKNCPDREFLLRVSYMEIYNENIRDLLMPGSGHLKIHEAAKSGVFVAGLTEEIVATPEQVFQVLNEGHKHRTVASNKVNEHSSRSHSIFRMVVESRERSSEDDSKEESDNQKSRRASVASTKERRKSTRTSLEGGAVKVSLLNLVDLAGSERVAYTSAEGKRLKEGCHINKSLLNLGNVIQKLSKGPSARRHIPYRSSKLTRILEPALGGNSRTAIVCTVTPASMHLDETHSTLKFANRAKMIQNTPVTNEVLDDKAMIRQYQKRMQDLEEFKKQVDQDKLSMNKQLEEKDRLHAEQQERIAKLEKVASMMLNSQSLSGVDFDDFALAASFDQQGGSSLAKSARQRRKHRETWCPGDQAALLEFQAASSSAAVPSSSAAPVSFEPLTHVGNVQANEEEMEQLRDENSALKEEVKSLTESLSLQKKEQRMEFCDKNAEYQQELSDLQEQLEHQELQNEELTQLLREAKQELAEKEEASDELQEAMLMEADSMQAELQQCQHELQQATEARDTALADADEAKKSLEDQEDFATVCLKKLEDAANAAEELQQQHDEQMHQMEQDLASSLAIKAEQRASIVEQKDTIEQLQREADNAKKESESAQVRIKSQEERIALLQEAISSRDAEIGERAALATLQEADIVTLQTLNSELEEAKATLEEQVVKLRLDLEYEQKISTELDSAAQDLKLAYEADIDQLQKQIQNKAMARRSSMSRGALTAASGDNDRREVERVKKDCERLQEREKQLLQNKSKLEQDKAQMDRELKKTLQQFQTIEKENEKLRQSYQKQKDMQQQLTAAEKQVSKLSKTAQRQGQLHSEQVAELSATIAQLGTDAEHLTAEATALQSKLQKTTAALEEETARVESLGAQAMADAEKHADQLAVTRKEMEDAMKESEEKCQQLQGTIAELERAVEALTRERDELKHALSDKEKVEEETKATLEQQAQQIDQQERSLQSLLDSSESKTQIHETETRMLQQQLSEKETELKTVLEQLTDSQYRLEEQQSTYKAQMTELKEEKERQKAASEVETANLRTCLQKQEEELEKKKVEHKKQLEELMGNLGNEKHEVVAKHEALKEKHRDLQAEQEKLQEQAMEVAVKLELAEEKVKDLTLEHETQRLQWSSTEAKMRAEMEDQEQEQQELMEELQEDAKKQERLHGEVVAELKSELDDLYGQVKENMESNACLLDENANWAEKLQQCDKEWKAKRKQYFSLMKEKSREWEAHKLKLQEQIEQLGLQLEQLQKDKEELKARQEMRTKRPDTASVVVFHPFSSPADENARNVE